MEVSSRLWFREGRQRYLSADGSPPAILEAPGSGRARLSVDGGPWKEYIFACMLVRARQYFRQEKPVYRIVVCSEVVGQEETEQEAEEEAVTAVPSPPQRLWSVFDTLTDDLRHHAAPVTNTMPLANVCVRLTYFSPWFFCVQAGQNPPELLTYMHVLSGQWIEQALAELTGLGARTFLSSSSTPEEEGRAVNWLMRYRSLAAEETVLNRFRFRALAKKVFGSQRFKGRKAWRVKVKRGGYDRSVPQDTPLLALKFEGAWEKYPLSQYQLMSLSPALAAYVCQRWRILT